MTASGGDWERLDAVAVTPTSRSSSASGGRQVHPLRLRRRRPVLAALDGGADIFQRRLRDVMIGATVILVPAVALNVWVTIVISDRLGAVDSELSGVFDDTGSGVEDVATWSAAVVASFVTAVVGHFAAVILIGERFRSPVSLGSALRRTGRRLPVILAAWFTTHWWFPVMALIVVTAQPDAAMVWFFVFAFASWFLASATLFVIPAMVAEQLGPFAAARRSLQLARRRAGICVVFVLIATFLALLLALGMGTLVPLLELTGFLALGDLEVIQAVMLQLIVLVIVPLTALSTAQAYIEVRVAGEGLDLVVDADSAFGPAASIGTIEHMR